MEPGSTTQLHEQDSRAIDRIGGTVATATLCDVSSQAVTQWRQKGIPKARRMYLQLLRPDVFETVEEKTSGAA